jgi:hypothetical protein
MKRRQLFEGIATATLWGSASGLPIAAARSDAGRSDEGAAAWLRHQTFHVVYYFDKGANDFRLAGIYSLKSDADAQVDRVNNSEAHTKKHVTCIGTAEVNDSWLKDFFVGERLGELKEVLERIESLTPKAPERT